MSQALHSRPSALIGIIDEVVAYCLDSAVARWGTSFEGAVQEATRDATDQRAADRAVQRVVRRWLRLPAQYATPGKQING